MEHKEQFGKLIVRLRERDGLSQKELAEKIYVVPSTVCKWEKGASVPDSGKLLQLSEFFQIPYEDLLEPEVTLQKMNAAPEMLKDEPEAESESEPKAEPEPEHDPELKSESKPKHLRRRIAIAAAAVIVVLCAAGAILYAREQSPTLRVQTICELYIEDPEFGTVYEISGVINTSPDIETLWEYEDEQVLPYVRQLELETDVVKISYYDNKTAMESGDTAHYYSYYFLSNYEDG